ncbi:sigma-70 family RNA polymerase sigma factor [bacterium]|nr:sigma-70 family RNA polymerase sigma factor [bacterium]
MGRHMSANRPSLLRSYCQSRTDAAFRAVVEAHIDLVYSAARRLAGGDFHLAEDISQTVFADLARKADRIPADAVLSAWLYRHTFFVASSMIRRERRRRDREQEAFAMDTILQTAEPDWAQLAPHLEEAMNTLAESDRLALVLRYFDKLDLHEIGTRLGISEDAAQKRVTRALEKLKTRFAKRGVTISLTALAASLFAHAVTAAPTALAGQVAAAVAGGVTAGTGILLTLQKLLSMNTFKPIVATLAIAGVATPTILQHQSLAAAGNQNAALTAQLSELERLRAENARLAKMEVDFNELESLRKEHLELMRLRGESTLRRDEIESLKRDIEHQRQLLAAKTETEKKETTEEERQALRQVTIETRFVDLPLSSPIWAEFGLRRPVSNKDSGSNHLMSHERVTKMLQEVEETKSAQIFTPPRVTTSNGRQAQVKAVGVRTIVTGKVGNALTTEKKEIGPILDLLPTFNKDDGNVHLTAVASLNQFLGYDDSGSATDSTPLPRLQLRQLQADAVLNRDYVLVMCGGYSAYKAKETNPSERLELKQSPTGLIVIVDPTEIDAAGNKVVAAPK